MSDEKYFFENNTNKTIVFGHFVEKVYAKHVADYGEKNAQKTRDRVRRIFLSCLNQLDDNARNNNVLLIGKVQSGKTSNLEMLTAIAFDNGYRSTVIYGGYDTKLLNQTSERFRKTFDITEDSFDSEEPELFSTDDGESIDALDDDLLDTIVDSGKPLIFVSMKRPVALRKVNNALQRLNANSIKTFIIDDEGDQASLNTEFKKDKKSATYKEIVEMKKKLANPLYLSVTATPQANVLLGEYSELKPNGLHLIEPGNGYTGAEFFHLDEDKIVTVDKEDVDSLENGEVPPSVYQSIFYFVISSAIMKRRKISYSDMIIHTSRTNKDHSEVYSTIYSWLSSVKENIKDNSDELNLQLKEIEKIYSKDYFSEEQVNDISFADLRDDIIDVLKNTHVILQDSRGKITQEHEKYKKHKIYVGGDLLQRGLTFKHLVTTYFTRWPKKSGNMDTIIQRARWFGYRGKFLDLCRIFTTFEIQKEYSALTESENDLWEQCYLIENGLMKIDDIIIDADSSTLNPTRKNVVDYRKLKFNRKWNNQRIGVFDLEIVKKNNKTLEQFIEKLELQKSSVGRTDSKTSCEYSYASYDDVALFINETDFVFSQDPFKRKDLLRILQSNKIVIQKMYDINSEYDVRERSFDIEKGRISALQQGADKADQEERKYLGDSYVVVDSQAVTIQVFRIRPKFNSVPNEKYDQYMYSIHVPEIRKGFVKNG